MVWPFSRAKPAGWTTNQVPTAAELNQIDEQAAQAADGSAWNDLTFGGNYPYAFTDTKGGIVCLYNPVNKFFYSFNVNAGNPQGFAAAAPFVSRSTETMATGFTPVVAAVDPVRGNMIVGGVPGSSNQDRIRRCDGLSSSWLSANTAKAAAIIGPTTALYCGGTFDEFFIGYNSGELESSTGLSAGAAWSNIAGLPNAFGRGPMAFSPTLNRLVVMQDVGGTSYLTSDNGTSFTARTAPVAFHYVFWSAFRQRFYAVQNTTPHFWTSLDGISWTSLGASSNHPNGTAVGAVQMFEFKRMIGCMGSGELALSLDGMTTWSSVVRFTGSGGFAVRSDSGFQALFANTSGNHWASLRIGI